MTRTNLPTTLLPGVSTTGLLDPAGTAIDQANGMNVVLASGSIPSAATAHNLFFRVANTAASALAFTVRAGAYPPSMRAGVGDLAVTVTNATTRWVGPLEGGRFIQADGSVNVDFATGFTGTITAFLSPDDQL